jgi:radical SAM superfamily enzyme YgiQ (UPF0313 family)
MKILFIKPAIYSARKTQSLQPLAIAILSAFTPPGIVKVFYDENIESIPFNEYADLVAISTETFTAKRAYQIADIYLQRNIPVIMGGIHPSIAPEEALLHATSVAIGDAENIWPQILSDFREGAMKRIYKSLDDMDPVQTRFDRSIFKNKKYLPFNTIQWSRGCKYNCEFCAIKSIYPGKQVSRPIDEVIGEISGLDKRPLFIVDDNICQNSDSFKEFLVKIAPLKKRWACQVSIDISRDDGLMELLGRSGCIMVVMGIESLDEGNLKQMNKSSNLRIKDIKSAIEKFRKLGIMIYGTFVFGYDNDDENQFEKAVSLAKSLKFAIANFNLLYPYPGTELYTRLEKENRLLFDKWWLDENFFFGKAMFKPGNLSVKMFEDACFRAKRSFNSFGSILSRAMDLKSNCRNISNTIIYFIMNLSNRKMVHRKQGKTLAKTSGPD